MAVSFIRKNQRRSSFQQGYARSAAESANPELWKNLQGAWIPFLGPTGSTIFDPLRKNNGTLTAVTPSAAWGVSSNNKMSGYHLAFDGSSSFQRIQLPNLYDQDDSYTWILYFNYVSLGDAAGNSVLVQQENGSGAGRSALFIDNDTGVIGTFLSGTNILGATDIGIGNDAVAAMEKSGSNYQLYLNGFLDGSGSGAAPNNDGQTRIAAHKSNVTSNADILLYVVYLFGAPLTAAEHFKIGQDPFALIRAKSRVLANPLPSGRVMSSLVGHGGLVAEGGLAGRGGGLAA